MAAQYEPKSVDISIVVDDTLCKGVESWGWYGLQPINELTKEGGTLLVTSKKSADELIPHIHKTDVSYNLCILDGEASFAGLWVYKDDHTDARILGAVAKLCPQLAGLSDMELSIRENLKDDDTLVESAHASFEDARLREVKPGEGDPEEPFSFDKPGWTNMEEGLVVRGIDVGGGFQGEEGGYEPGTQSLLQEVEHPDHAARGQLRDVHEMHTVLDRLSGFLLRRDARILLRREHGGLLRLRRLRADLPGQ